MYGVNGEMTQSLLYKAPEIPGLEVLSCTTGLEFGNHLHDGHVVWLNSECGEEYSLKGTRSILKPGQISIIEPGEVHANKSSCSNKRHLRSFYLDHRFIQYLGDHITPGQDFSHLDGNRVLEDPILWENLRQLHEYLFTSEDSFEMELSVVDGFAPIFSSDAKRIHSIETRRIGKRVSRVVEFYHEHIADSIQLTEVANIADCSSYYLIRLFRRQTGMSPHAYLTQLRLEHARKLLHKGTEIADSAVMSGFSDQSHLTRKFKMRYGVTPGEYCLQLRNK